MKPITRNLFTYQADILATAAELDSRLPHFTDPGQHERSSFGFIPVVPDSESRVLQFTGGWALCYREDKKLLPSATVRKAVDEKAQAIAVATGRRPGKKERNEIKADVIYELLAQAFVNSKLTYVIYSTRTNRLFVNTSAQKTSDAVVSALVHALESVKTSTVHVSEPAMGLTQRLLNWLDDKDDEECFGSFYPCDEIVLGNRGRKWSVKVERLREAEPTMRNAIDKGAKVDSMRFQTEDEVAFRIDQSLRLKGVKHRAAPEDSINDDAPDASHVWHAQLTLEVAALDAIMDELLDLLSPEKAQGSKATDPLADLFG